MAVEQIGIADRLQQPVGQQHRILGARQPALDDREFVGVEAGKRVLLAQGGAQALGDAAQQLVADAMAERIVDGLEVVEAEHQHRDLFRAAPRVQQDIVHLLAQQIAVRQPGQTVMLRHEGKPRLGALALGDIHQRQQHRGLVVVDQLARIDRQIDQGAVGPDMLPGTRGLFVAGTVATPWQLGFEGLDAADGQFLEFGAAIAVMFDGGVVDAENALVVERADDHGDGVAVEQQPERGLALLQLGDVDAQADDAAVLGQPLLDQDDAAVGQCLLVASVGLVQFGQPLGDPLILAADRFRIVAALDTDANGILQPGARLEQVGAAVVDLGILLVPENVAPVGVEKHDALRQDVDRLTQPLVGFSRLRDRRLGLGALAHDLADLGCDAPALAFKPAFKLSLEFWAGLCRPAGNPGNRRVLDFLGWLRPETLHCLRPLTSAFLFSDKCLKNW